MGAKVDEGPGDIVPAVGGKAQEAPRLQDAMELSRHGGGDDAPLEVAPLRPRVGKQQENATDAAIAERRHELPRVAIVNPDIVEAPLFDGGEKLGDAVDIGLAADEADARVGRGLPGEVLAAAEADLEPDILDRCGVELSRVPEPARAGLGAQARQEL